MAFERQEVRRQAAASAYADAVAAVHWLNTDRAQEVKDTKWAEELAPGYRAATSTLASTRRELDRISALEADDELASSCRAVAEQLGQLNMVFDSAATWAHYSQNRTGEIQKSADRIFDREWKRLWQVRYQLLGERSFEFLDLELGDNEVLTRKYGGPETPSLERLRSAIGRQRPLTATEQ